MFLPVEFIMESVTEKTHPLNKVVTRLKDDKNKEIRKIAQGFMEADDLWYNFDVEVYEPTGFKNFKIAEKKDRKLIRQIEKVIQHYPNNPDLYLLAVIIFTRPGSVIPSLKETKFLEKYLAKLLQLQDEPLVHRMLAGLYCDMAWNGEYSKIEEGMRECKYLLQYPSFKDEALELLKKIDEYKKEYQKASSLMKKDRAWRYYERGKAYYRDIYRRWSLCRHKNIRTWWLFQKSQRQFKKAMAIKANFVKAYCYLGDLNRHFGLGSPSQAIAAYQEAIRLQPNDMFLRYELANIYKQKASSQESCKKWLSYLEGNSLRKRLKRARVRKEWGYSYPYKPEEDYKRAVKVYQEIIQLIPADAKPHFRCGLIYCGYLKLYQEAIIEFEKGLALDPKEISIRFELAEAYRAIGQDKEALSNYQFYLKHISDSDGRDSIAKERIRELKQNKS